MTYRHTIDSEEFRNLIVTPKSKQQQCQNCGGTGWENWNEDGEDIKKGRCNDEGRTDGECEICRGIGYVF